MPKFLVTVMETCTYRCDCIVEAETADKAEDIVREEGPAAHEDKRELHEVLSYNIDSVEPAD
jgi:hypothetical protein